MFEELMPNQRSLKTEQLKHKTNEANYTIAHCDQVTQKPTVKGKSGNIQRTVGFYRQRNQNERYSFLFRKNKNRKTIAKAMEVLREKSMSLDSMPIKPYPKTVKIRHFHTDNSYQIIVREHEQASELLQKDLLTGQETWTPERNRMGNTCFLSFKFQISFLINWPRSPISQ